MKAQISKFEFVKGRLLNTKEGGFPQSFTKSLIKGLGEWSRPVG